MRGRKDWKGSGTESHTGVIPGTGDGKIEYSIRDAVKQGYKGYAVMEPHLRGGGPTGGNGTRGPGGDGAAFPGPVGAGSGLSAAGFGAFGSGFMRVARGVAGEASLPLSRIIPGRPDSDKAARASGRDGESVRAASARET